jgi:hypothetical protein
MGFDELEPIKIDRTITGDSYGHIVATTDDMHRFITSQEVISTLDKIVFDYEESKISMYDYEKEILSASYSEEDRTEFNRTYYRKKFKKWRI